MIVCSGEAEQITRNAINVSHDVSLRPALKDWKEQYDTGEIILSHEAVSLVSLHSKFNR